jgi:hypothetical protein
MYTLYLSIPFFNYLIVIVIIVIADYGIDHERYVSTIATKGVGHLVRKGTGGRSSVRLISFIHSVFSSFLSDK